MEEEKTLNPEQIKSWRMIIAMRLNSISPGSGIAAHFLPESEIISYWRKMKAVLESPESNYPQSLPDITVKTENFKKKCSHSNSINGQNGKYCLDCEKYI